MYHTSLSDNHNGKHVLLERSRKKNTTFIWLENFVAKDLHEIMEKDGYGYVCSKIRAPEIKSIRNERPAKERGKELIITKHQITSEITVEQPFDSLTIFFLRSFALLRQ